MTTVTPQTTVNQTQENKPSDKEINFRNLEARYQRELEQERAARLEAEKKAKEAMMTRQREQIQEEDDNDSEPYVDHKKLNKTLARQHQNTQSEIQKAMQVAKETAKEEVRRELWVENTPDFEEVLGHAQKLYDKHQKLAENILRMPESFERQKLVYQTIKELGLNKPESKEPTIQDKVDANRRNPYYQPSGVGTAPYASAGDFSATGQKQAYSKMQELKNRLRLG